MNRKHCVLLYSKYSQASIDLLSYIEGLSFDFPKVIGMTMTCIDYVNFKDVLDKNDIKNVPTLLVEYYAGSTINQTKQKFESEYIYMWIDQVINELKLEHNQVPEQPVVKGVGKGVGRTMLVRSATELPDEELEPPSDTPPIQKKERIDVTSLAQQMAKERDLQISETDKKRAL
jgi:hypothetical protein